MRKKEPDQSKLPVEENRLLSIGSGGYISYFLDPSSGSIFEYNRTRKGKELTKFGEVVDKPEIIKEEGRDLLRYRVRDVVGLFYDIKTDGKKTDIEYILRSEILFGMEEKKDKTSGEVDAKEVTEFDWVDSPVEKLYKGDGSVFRNLKNVIFIGRNGNDGRLIGSYLKNKKIEFDDKLGFFTLPLKVIKSIYNGNDPALECLTYQIFLGKARGHTAGIPLKSNKSLGYTH